MSAAILIVDDNPAHRRLVVRAISKAGLDVSVTEAASLKEAREMLFNGGSLAPQIAVIDLHLGDGKGSDLVAELRQNPSYAALPILMLSTSALESDIRECYEQGVNCYLTKSEDLQTFTWEISQGVSFLLERS